MPALEEQFAPLRNPGRAARTAARSENVEGYTVIGRPGQFLSSSPARGDVLVRSIEGGAGHATVLESDEGFGRHMDTAGRLLEDLVLLRLATAPAASPTVIRVDAPAASPLDDPLLATAGAATQAAEDELSCDHIDASQLSWPGASQNALDLMRRVYLRQVGASCQVRSFVGDVADSDLAAIENGVKARREAADNCRRLLADARSALASDPTASAVSSIGLVSGYRSASQQLSNWNRNFSRYYNETKTDRAALSSGEFGDEAAALLTRYISRRLAAPGFSLHNDGRAIDFSTVDHGHSLGADTSAASRSRWRASWFFQWLIANANGYGFYQNTSIDEPWHWEFRGVPAQSSQSYEAFTGCRILLPDTVEPFEFTGRAAPLELTIATGRVELSNTPLLATHNGTQPDLILRWNDMTDPSTVDTVVHLHGYSKDRAAMQLRNKEAYSGLDFSNPDNPSDTRPGRTSPTLGILPRGSYTGNAAGANPERYTFPALVSPTAIRDLISYSLSQFQSATGASGSLSTGRFIITAHSGGGYPLMNILANNRPDEIHVFDALYWDASALISWVNARIASEIQSWTSGKTRPDGGLCILYRKKGTETQSLLVHRAIRNAISHAPSDAQPVLRAAYRVLRTGVAHGDIPRRFGWRLLGDITADLSSDGVGAPESAEAVQVAPRTRFASSAAEDVGDGSPFVSQALDSCWAQVQSLRSSLSAATNPARVSRLKIASESRVSVDHNPYATIGKGQLEAVIRAGFNSNQMPETLLALWAKEGSLRMSTTATAVPNASTADNARSLFRSGVYYVHLGSDTFIATTYDPVQKDNVWANTDAAAPTHEAKFRSQVADLVTAGVLSQDISAAIDAELSVSSGPPFSVTASVKFYALSLLLMDALFTRMQRNTFPQLSSISEAMNYLQWNMRGGRFAEFLTSADQHRQEPAFRLPSGDQPTIEQWALHTPPKGTEWKQPRINAIRFMYYMESYRPIFATALNLIKPGIEDLRLPGNAA